MSTFEGDSDTKNVSALAESSPVPTLRYNVSRRGSWAWPLPIGVEGPDVDVLGIGIVGVAEGRLVMLSYIMFASVGLSELGAFVLVIVERFGGCVARASSRKPVIMSATISFPSCSTYGHGCQHLDGPLLRQELLPQAVGYLYLAILTSVTLMVS